MGSYYSSHAHRGPLPNFPFQEIYSGGIPDSYTSLDQLKDALQREGLESSNLIIGVDFTKSNESTGKNSFNGRSLHHLGEAKNPYEQAISIIGKTLSDFDEDNLIPCFGFGDVSTHDKQVFSFYPHDRPCNGIGDVLARYRELVPDIKLAGPTSFAPIIDKAREIVERSGYLYHVLLIIADGQVSASRSGNLSYQEECTIRAIQRASNFPLSIVLVGVGDGPWDLANQYDDSLAQRCFDNFQFVNFTEIMSMDMTNPAKEEAFALQALMEIPSQFAEIKRRGILGAPPGRSVPQFRNMMICSVCRIRVRDMVFGCGHETCSDCGERLYSCPDCQSNILTRVWFS